MKFCPARTAGQKVITCFAVKIYFRRQTMASAWAGFRPAHAYPANPVNPVKKLFIFKRDQGSLKFRKTSKTLSLVKKDKRP